MSVISLDEFGTVFGTWEALFLKTRKPEVGILFRKIPGHWLCFPPPDGSHELYFKSRYAKNCQSKSSAMEALSLRVTELQHSKNGIF